MPTVIASRVIDAQTAEVWALIRDFGSHSRWIEHHPSITLENGDGMSVGVRRRVTYDDGSYFDEILTGQDDRSHFQEYDVIGDLPLPVYNVSGAMRLHEVTADNATLVVRTLTYDTPLDPVEAEAFAKTRHDLLAKSLDILADLLD